MSDPYPGRGRTPGPYNGVPREHSRSRGPAPEMPSPNTVDPYKRQKYYAVANQLLNTFKKERKNNAAAEKEGAFAKAIADAVNNQKTTVDKKKVLTKLLSKNGLILKESQIAVIVSLGQLEQSNIVGIFDVVFSESAVAMLMKLSESAGQSGGAYNQRGGGPLLDALSHAASKIKTTVRGALTTGEAVIASGIDAAAGAPLTTFATLSAALRIGGIGKDLTPTLSSLVWNLVSQGPSFLRNAACNLVAGSAEAATLAGGLITLAGIAGIGVASVLALSRVRALMCKGVKLTSETAKDKLLALATYDPVIEPEAIARSALPVFKSAAAVGASVAAGAAAGVAAGAEMVKRRLLRSRAAAMAVAAEAAVAPAAEAAVRVAAQNDVTALLAAAEAAVPAEQVPDAADAAADAVVNAILVAHEVAPVVQSAAVDALAAAAIDAAVAAPGGEAAMDVAAAAVGPVVEAAAMDAAVPGGEPDGGAGAAMVPGGGYRKSHRKAHRKSHRKAHRKSHRKAHRKSHRKIHKYRLKNKKTRRA